MKEIIGRYAKAIVYTDMIDDAATEQIRQLCDQPVAEGSCIRIMPDVHAGTDCVIGFTANMGEIIVPSLIGADIGCGVLTVELGKEPIDFEKLDRIIRWHISRLGHDSIIVQGEYLPAKLTELKDMRIYDKVKSNIWIEGSKGKLRGGNHFIEVDVDDEGMQYLVIHGGSRTLGKLILDHYQNLAYDTLYGRENKRIEELQRHALVEGLKASGKKAEIMQALKNLPPVVQYAQLPKHFCYLTGKEREDYLHDMDICQEFAAQNRRQIADTLLFNLLGKHLNDFYFFDVVHNYIDRESHIIRKGAVSAKLGEKLLIPLNMRDGSLICTGKGNSEWNCSAPHGAGRLLSREAARDTLSMEEYAREMQGIFTTSVAEATLDESPIAYKPTNQIMIDIAPAVEIVKAIRPVYNFKSAKDRPVPNRKITENHIRHLARFFTKIMPSMLNHVAWHNYLNTIAYRFNKSWQVIGVDIMVRDPEFCVDECDVCIERKSEFLEFISRLMDMYLIEHPDEAEKCHADYAALLMRLDRFKDFQ